MEKAMKAETNSSFAKLERREMIELREGTGNAIVCLSGSLWVTRQGHCEDIILKPGQSIVLDGKGYAVAQGLRYSTLRVIRRASAETLGDWLREKSWAATRTPRLRPAAHS
jgi:hypothetical protein